jgi:hypothetical protein
MRVCPVVAHADVRQSQRASAFQRHTNPRPSFQTFLPGGGLPARGCIVWRLRLLSDGGEGKLRIGTVCTA